MVYRPQTAEEKAAENLENMQAARDRLYLEGVKWPQGMWAALSYSTEMLQADVTFGGFGVMTHSRQAAELLKLDTVERRKRAYGEAHTRQNLWGGVLSNQLYGAVRDLLKMIEEGREHEEMQAAGIARRAREEEKRLREVTGNPNAIYYPSEMRRS